MIRDHPERECQKLIRHHQITINPTDGTRFPDRQLALLRSSVTSIEFHKVMQFCPFSNYPANRLELPWRGIPLNNNRSFFLRSKLTLLDTYY